MGRGRPSKGLRARVDFWIDPAVKNAAVAKATSLGMSFTDYISQLVAKDVGPTAAKQEESPFADVA